MSTHTLKFHSKLNKTAKEDEIQMTEVQNIQCCCTPCDYALALAPSECRHPGPRLLLCFSALHSETASSLLLSFYLHLQQCRNHLRILQSLKAINKSNRALCTTTIHCIFRCSLLTKQSTTVTCPTQLLYMHTLRTKAR